MPRFEHQCTVCRHREESFVPGGEHPSCVRCLSPTEYIWRATGASHGIVTDEAFIGGMTLENLGHEPVTVYSRTELARKMHEAGVVQKIKWSGPNDKFLTNWAAGIDAQTLANAKALVERNGLARADPPEVTVNATFTITTLPIGPRAETPKSPLAE